MKHRKFKLNDEEIRALQERESVTRDALELKRLQGVRLYGSGEGMGVVQQVTGGSRRTVQRWVDDYEADGIGGLRPGWRGGNNRKLSEAERAAISDSLHSLTPEQVLSAEWRLSQGVFWTVSDVQQLLQGWYGVDYRSVRSYQTLLQACGFSYQRTEGIYRSRPSEAVIAEFEAQAEKK